MLSEILLLVQELRNSKMRKPGDLDLSASVCAKTHEFSRVTGDEFLATTGSNN